MSNHLKELRRLAGLIPCELCLIKGSNHIQEDGGCRHRPSIDESFSDAEVVDRIKRAVTAYKAGK